MQSLSYFDTVNQKQRSRAITLPELAELSATPTVRPKKKAAVIAPHSGDHKTKDAAESYQFGAIVVDHDRGDIDRYGIAANYYGRSFLAYTTASHRQDGNGDRWKVVLPLSEPVNAGTYLQLAKSAAETMHGDTSQARVQQIFFAPNKLNDGAPYDCINALNDDPIDPSTVLKSTPPATTPEGTEGTEGTEGALLHKLG